MIAASPSCVSPNTGVIRITRAPWAPRVDCPEWTDDQPRQRLVGRCRCRRPTEGVDGLFGVEDQDQGRGPVEHLPPGVPLHRVGVLELIDHDHGELAARHGACGRPGGGIGQRRVDAGRGVVVGRESESQGAARCSARTAWAKDSRWPAGLCGSSSPGGSRPSGRGRYPWRSVRLVPGGARGQGSRCQISRGVQVSNDIVGQRAEVFGERLQQGPCRSAMPSSTNIHIAEPWVVSIEAWSNPVIAAPDRARRVATRSPIPAGGSDRRIVKAESPTVSWNRVRARYVSTSRLRTRSRKLLGAFAALAKVMSRSWSMVTENGNVHSSRAAMA